MRIHWQSLFLCLAAISYLVTGRAVLPVQAQPLDSSPLVLAFYYNWYDENTWIPTKVIDTPLETYVSRDRAAMTRQVEQARLVGIDAFVVSWYGPQVENNQTEPNFSTLLDVAQEQGFKAAIDFETASPFIHGQGETVAALQHILNVHALRESYLKPDGKPVIFFWAIDRVPLASGQTSALEAWRSIRQQVDPERKSLWIAEGVDIKYQEAFDGHHLYNVAWAKSISSSLSDWGNRVRKWSSEAGQPRLWVATVMPGWNDLKTGRTSAYVRERQNGAFYEECWRAAIASRPDWIIITSFNEWIENSYIEPSQNYGHLYLDLTQKWSEGFKSGTISPDPVPPPTDTPAIEPTPTMAVALLATSTTVAISTVASLELTSPELSSEEIGVALVEAESTADTPTPEEILDNKTERSPEEIEAISTPEPAYGEIVASKVPLRDGPGEEFSVVGLLHKGFIVQILETSPDEKWLKIITPTGETGYAEVEFVEPKAGLIPSESLSIMVTSPPISQVEISPVIGTTGTGVVISETKLRRGPSSSFGAAAKVEIGDTFEIITSNLDGSWYQVRLADGQEGWILAYKTQPVQPTATASPALSIIATVEVTETAPPSPDVTITPESTAAPTEEVVIAAAPPTAQVGFAQALSQDSSTRGQTLFGVILIIAGVGTFLVAIGLGVIYLTSRRAH